MDNMRWVSTKELAGILAVLAFAAIYAAVNPELLGAAPRAKGLTVQMVHRHPYRHIQTQCAKESYPVSCTARLVREAARRSASPTNSPLRAGEQMRSTPPSVPLQDSSRSALCEGGGCTVRRNAPTEAWERTAVPRIDTVAAK